MKRELTILLCFVCLSYAEISRAENRSDWGVLLQNMATTVNATNNSNTDELVQLKNEYREWSEKVSISEANTQNSFVNLVSAISPKSEAAKINKNIDIINDSNLSTVDKSAQAAQIIYDYSVNLQNNKTSVTQLFKNITSEKRDEISLSLKDLSAATSDYTTSLTQGSNLLKKITANPKLGLSMASEYTELGKRLKTVNTTLNSLNNIVNTLSPLLSK